MNIDCEIITIVPRNVDYPAYRRRLKELAPYFNRIHYVFSYNSYCENVVDYKELIREDTSFCNFIEVDMANLNEHWYDAAMTRGINQCASEYILILEPDFIFDVKELINVLSTFTRDILTYGICPTEHPIVGKIYPRLSPAFFMVRRSLVLQTSQDFSEGMTDNYIDFEHNSDGSTTLIKYPTDEKHLVDCFNKFTNELLGLTTDICLLSDLDVNTFHYAGITHNFTLCRMGCFDTLHKVSEFVKYLQDNLNIDGVAYHQTYIDETNAYLAAIAAL